MHPYQQRVIDEKAELEAKASALLAFVGSESFKALSPSMIAWMRIQHYHMVGYSQALAARIEIFNEGAEE